MQEIDCCRNGRVLGLLAINISFGVELITDDGEGTAVAGVQAEPKQREEDALAEFQAEMGELGVLDTAEGLVQEPEEERAATPDPEDQRFEDDDGTIYVWDPALRKFVEEGSDVGAALAAAQQPGYNVDDMTFEMDEEVIPVYNPPVVRPHKNLFVGYQGHRIMLKIKQCPMRKSLFGEDPGGH